MRRAMHERSEPPAVPSQRADRFLAASAVTSALVLYAAGLPPVLYNIAFVAAGATAIALLWLRWPRAREAAVLIAASCAALALADLFLRHALEDTLYYRPHDRFAQRWPPMPELSRYAPDAFFEGETWGDLAATAGRADLREMRRVRFETDARGFRNSRPDPASPLDLILLGDSFGVGSGTSQEATWSALLGERGYRIYNLSMPKSPWQERMSLGLELPRLPTRPGTTVLWALFVGNDLEDHYAGPLVARLRGPIAQLGVRFRSFRLRSPTRQLLDQALRDASAHANDRVEVRALPDGGQLLFYRPYAASAALPVEQVRAHPNFSALDEVFASMRTLAAAHGLNVMVVMVPAKIEVYDWLGEEKPRAVDASPSGLASALAELAEREGFAFVDLKPDFARRARALFKDTGQLLWWRDDTHWREHGHALAADLVDRALRERGWGKPTP